MKVMLFGFFTVRPVWTETADNVSARAYSREGGERGFLHHGASRKGLALLHDKIVGTQQQKSTFQFPDSVLGAQRLEKSKDLRLHFSADFCPGWGHQALSTSHNVHESHRAADEVGLSREVVSAPCTGCLVVWWLGNLHRRYQFGRLAGIFQTRSSSFLLLLKPLGC